LGQVYYRRHLPTTRRTKLSTLDGRPNTALLVVDVQNGVVAGAHDRDAVVSNIDALVDRARESQVPVVWVRQNDGGLKKGSDEWQIVSELDPAETEPVIEKSYGDSFEDTNLESVLADLAVG